MRLCEPALSFSIPSVHDGLLLECRVYHPTSFAPTSLDVAQWRKRAAIVAHPYAPLGGCYDDPIVTDVVSATINQGFIVGTFNFRGAGSSQGRTSWQSKPEQNDYVSFIAFMVHYLHYLEPQSLPMESRSSKSGHSEPGFPSLSPIPSQVVPPPKVDSEYHSPSSSNIECQDTNPLLLLSGYSYGALITSTLPPIVMSSLSSFQTPAVGSPQAEIRMRAASLADEQNKLINVHNPSQPDKSRIQIDALTSPRVRRRNSGVRVGGHEDLRKSSQESQGLRRSASLDLHVWKSVERVRSIAKSGAFEHRRRDSSSSVASSPKESKNPSAASPSEENETLSATPNIGEGLRVAYLLISPLHGWINSLATMSLVSFGTLKNKVMKESSALSEHEMKLTIAPTLALFGDDDIFVSASKLRAWAEKLRSACEKRESPQFRYREVPGAGHFWRDEGAVQILKEEVDSFVSSL